MRLGELDSVRIEPGCESSRPQLSIQTSFHAYITKSMTRLPNGVAKASDWWPEAVTTSYGSGFSGVSGAARPVYR